MTRSLHFGLLGLCFGLIWGCAVMPAEVNNRAMPPVALSVLIKDANRYRGETVILGGYVISVENKAGHTRIVAVQAPLGAGQRPQRKDLSEGRLVLEYAGFIDPEVYTRDRQITVGGKIVSSSASDQRASYPYLKLQVQEIHLWPVAKPLPDPYWQDDFYPYYYPWWRHPYWYHRHRHY
jgi:outer membrane lipoprotein